MIQVNAQNTLSIHFVNDSDSSRNDIRAFTNLIKTCMYEANKPGFSNMFDDEQRDLIRSIAKEILPQKTNDVNITAEKELIK